MSVILSLVVFYSLSVNSRFYKELKRSRIAVMTTSLAQDYLMTKDIKKDEYKGYIIQFKNQSILEKKAELENTLLNQKKENLNDLIENNAGENIIDNLKKEIEVTDLKIKNELDAQRKKNKDERVNAVKNITEVISKQPKIFAEFDKALNAVALDISDEEAQKLSKLPYIENISPNYITYINLKDSVPLINADKVWQLTDSLGKTVTGKGVKVAIIDTGIDYTHPDFGSCTTAQFTSKTCPKFADGYDFVNSDNDPIDDNGHGTHVAGIIAANGTVRGVAPGVVLATYKTLDSEGSGPVTDQISALERAMDPNQDGSFTDHANIISMSLGSANGNPDDAFSKAVDNVVNNGAVTVVAAGNNGPTGQSIDSPGTAKQAITVAASDKSDVIASFSSRGPVIWNNLIYMKPDITAPGVNICSSKLYTMGESTCIDSNHIQMSGTSMATPHISGVAALILQKYPSFKPYDVKKMIKLGAISLNQDMPVQGTGRVNVYNSIVNKSPKSGVFEPGITIESYSMTDNFNGDGLVNPGETMKLTLNISSWGAASSVNAQLKTSDTCVSIPTATSNFGSMVKSSIANNSAAPLAFTVLKSCPVDKVLPFTISITAGTYSYTYPINFKVNKVTLPTNAATSDPIISDLDGDGDLEILASSGWGSVYAWHHTGQILPGWPKKVSDYFASQPAVGDINGDGKPEIVVSARYKDNYSFNFIDKIYAYSITGSLLSGWPVQSNSLIDQRLAIGDIDHDGKNEIVAASDRSSNIYIWRGDGSILSIFSISTDQYNMLGNLAIGDLDKDGKLEIVTTINNQVKAFRSNGTMVSGWPKNISSKGVTMLGDVNNDGYLEVVIFSNDYATNNAYVYSYAGSLLYTWTLSDSVYPILADIDSNGDLEIIGSGQNIIYAWHYDGTPITGWPDYGTIEKYSTIPVVADTNNSCNSEIVIKSNVGYGGATKDSLSKLFIKDNNANLLNVGIVDMSEYRMPYQSLSSAIGDIDNDGLLEVVYGTNKNLLDIQEIATTALNKNKLQWPMLGHDSQHTNNYNSSPSNELVLSTNAMTTSPVTADLNGDGKLEIVAGTEKGYLYVWNSNGKVATGWPKTISSNSYRVESPAIGDINADGKPDIITATYFSNGTGKVFAYNYSGTAITGWPKDTAGSLADNTQAIDDIDGDGKNEVVAVTRQPANLYVWRGSGQLLTGFPLSLGGTFTTGLAIGDLNKDGKKDIAVTVDGNLKIYQYNGTTVPGWDYPKKINSNSEIAMGDVNNDGNLEVVVAPSNIYIYGNGGALLTTISLGVSGIPILADVDGDSDLEIFITSGSKTYAYHHNGTILTGWPVTFNTNIVTPPIIGSVYNSTNPNIVVLEGNLMNSWTKIYVMDKNGKKIGGDKDQIGYTLSPMGVRTPTIGDIDKDGMLELVTNTEKNNVIVRRIGNSVLCNAKKLNWSTYRHDPKHTGLYVK